MKKMTLAFFMLLLTANLLWADSIWNDKLGSPYTTQKALHSGDIITVIILETTSATQKSGTDTSVKDELSSKFTHTVQRLYNIIGPTNELAGEGKNIYKGLGSTLRSSQVQAKISAKIIEVLPNGNLKIEGQHNVEVNEEIQHINISGIVRPKDVSIANSIYSYQVADAEISIKGKGAVGEAASPGWIVRILNWFF